MVMDQKERKTKQIALAHKLLEVIQTPEWQSVMLPYFTDERDVMIETMASLTDSLQLMRYAGSVQTLNSMLRLESRCRQIIEQGIDEKLEKFN
jgi:hypothetical protein